ncbi:uncharacterized protein LOC114240527 [Bombyx mandarina]|uniref:Uncharacterized protein LOC114240527 n=1 Tax=Bombyx mandarina TaxID=7092 RepID=A0A6J2JCS3_BOMMA|nr:uncharacterized protein LOC114240527 [Bombyx mandarina]
MSFSSKIVLITGASRGIGAATAIMFAKEGADVVIVGRNEEKLKEVEVECSKFGKKPLVITADLAKDEQVKGIVNKTIDAFGKLDILINNAGILKKNDIKSEGFIETFDEVMNTNLRASVLITNVAIPHLIKTRGNIINVSSVAATSTSVVNSVTYKVSKAALNHFTRCIALELAPHGIRANTVSPGPVETDIFETAGIPEALQNYSGQLPLKKVGKKEEVADLILFLASEKAQSITGANYVIDNGWLLN